MLMTIGTNDTLASPASQLDLYQAVIDKMGRSTVDGFARFFVLPQTGHGLSGTNYSVNGDGNKIETQPIPNTYDRLTLLTEWVEKNVAPGKSIKVTAGGRSLPMCSYPDFPNTAKALSARRIRMAVVLRDRDCAREHVGLRLMPGPDRLINRNCRTFLTGFPAHGAACDRLWLLLSDGETWPASLLRRGERSASRTSERRREYRGSMQSPPTPRTPLRPAPPGRWYLSSRTTR